MADTDDAFTAGDERRPSGYEVGFCKPPVHSRFRAGESGNPSGRPKGTRNLKTLFHKILGEEVSLREGAEVRKVSKAEAVVRGLVIGAMKGDPRSVAMLLRLAEQVGEFESTHTPITQITHVVVGWEDGKPTGPYNGG